MDHCARVRIVAVDDNAAVRRSLQNLLATYADVQLIGEAADGAGALRAAISLAPDVILLEVHLRGSSGLEVLPQIRDLAPSARIIVLTSHDGHLSAAVAHGAHGYLLKCAADEHSADAIRTVHRGGLWVPPYPTAKRSD